MSESTQQKGALAFMARNSVAANLVMLIFIIGGILMAINVKQEVFPEFELDIISVAVPYPGASPAEVEQGILLAIEEEVRGLEGVKEVRSTANEGAGTVMIELLSDANGNKALQDVKNAVDQIRSFPQDAERPTVSLVSNRRQVVSLMLYGEMPDSILRDLAEQIRDELLHLEGITSVDLVGVRPREIHIEVPQKKLRELNLTLPQIAQLISNTALELPAGGVKTEGGEILLRTQERRDYGSEFRDIPIVSRPDGSTIKLGDLAMIRDGFRETDQQTYFYGQNAVRISVFRMGDQKPLEITAQVREKVDELRKRLPETVGVSVWEDRSEIYADRIDLLMRNAFLGLTLVLFILGLFLDIRLAFWVTMGILISVLGSFLFMPMAGASINMISLFAFIVTLGIIVDDAVVVGENVFEYRQKGMSNLQAAIEGTREIAVPVSFSILTNIVAFMPMFFVEGVMGKFFWQIPIVVISVFVISWIESLFVLPAHLGHQKKKTFRGVFGFLIRQQQKFTHFLDWFIQSVYTPLVRTALRFRYLTIAAGIAVLIMTLGYIIGGHIEFTFRPKIDTDVVICDAVLPFGAPVDETKEIQEYLLQCAKQVLDKYGGDKITRGLFAQVGSTGQGMGGPSGNRGGAGGSHLANVQVFMVPSDERPISAAQFAKEWGDLVGELPSLESLTFNYNVGPSSGAAIDFELSHPNIGVLQEAAAQLADAMHAYASTRDINDGFERGKLQFDLKLKPAARSLGITTSVMARQIRSAFYGERAIRQQRGRDEIWVMVRLPEEERISLYDIGNLLIRTPGGGEIPLREAAEITIGRSYTKIERRDGQRVVNVTADVPPGAGNPNQIVQDMEENVLPAILDQYPRLTYSLEGEQRDQQESLQSLGFGYVFALIVIYALLAIPFKSYIQPVIVMAAIPFGMVGAVGGHLLMGYDFSIISMFGIVALTGVVVNDSLVLIDAANRYRLNTKDPFEAIVGAGKRRFRPILLTSLTTFFGLAPMIFETSVQARFLIPMAISLGYGILFVTVIALILVPALYMIVDDMIKVGLLAAGQVEDEEELEQAAMPTM